MKLVVLGLFTGHFILSFVECDTLPYLFRTKYFDTKVSVLKEYNESNQNFIFVEVLYK